MLLVCVASGWDSWRARRLTLADNDREMSSLASAIAEQTARSLQEVELILRRTSVWERDPRNQLTTPAEKAAFLAHQIEGLPQIREVTIADENGARTATSIPAAQFKSEYRQSPVLPGFEKGHRRGGGGERTAEESHGRQADLRRRDSFAGLPKDGLRASHGRWSTKTTSAISIRRIDLGPGAAIRLLRDGGTPIVRVSGRDAE